MNNDAEHDRNDTKTADDNGCWLCCFFDRLLNDGVHFMLIHKFLQRVFILLCFLVTTQAIFGQSPSLSSRISVVELKYERAYSETAIATSHKPATVKLAAQKVLDSSLEAEAKPLLKEAWLVLPYDDYKTLSGNKTTPHQLYLVVNALRKVGQ